MDNSRDQTKYWQGLREQEEGIMPSANDIKKIEHLGIPYFFKWFRRQSFDVCNKEIGRLYEVESLILLIMIVLLFLCLIEVLKHAEKN